MGLLNSIREAFGGKPERKLESPANFETGAAGEDPEDMFSSVDMRPQPNVDGMVLGLTYQDTAGNISRRMVRVIAIGESDRGDYVHAFCELRQAERTFFIKRVQEVVDHHTGHVHTDAAEFFLPYVEIAKWRDYREDGGDGEMSNPTQIVLTAVRDDIKIILYVAYADGDFQVDEQDVLSDFIAKRAKACGPDVAQGYDHRRIMSLVRSMRPDYASFERAVQRVAKRDELEIGDVWHTCKKLVMADRDINPREVDAMDSLFVAIRQAGISTRLE